MRPVPHRLTSSPLQGFVDLALVATFSRLAAVLGLAKPARGAGAPPRAPPSAETLAALAEALKASTTIVVSDDGARVRRAAPLPPPAELAAAADARSVYAAPFAFDATIDALTTLFSAIAPVASVRLRRHVASKDFKGSAFVEFETAAGAEAALAAAASNNLLHEGAPLRLERKPEFVARKVGERKAKAVAAAAAAAAAPATPAPAAPAPTPPAAPAAPGCLLSFTVDGGDADAALEYGEVKEAFGARAAGLAYVELTPGARGGVLRFRTPADADSALERAGQGGEGVTVGGGRAVAARLAAADEAEFYARADAAKAAADAREQADGGGGRGRGRGRGGGRGFRGGGRGGGRGGRGGGRGRGGDRGRGAKRSFDGGRGGDAKRGRRD